MTTALGVLALGVVVTGTALVAVALRRRLVPGWRGTRARLVELLLAHVAALLVAQALGTAGLLTRPALVAVWVVLGAAAWWWRGTDDPVDDARPPEPRWLRAGALAGVGVVLVQWLSVVPDVLRTGVLAVDALHYHLTYSALFAQTGSTTELHRLSVPDPTTWYPLSDELLQAVGVVLLGSDVLVLGWGLLALAGTLLAAHVLGGSRAVLAACVLLATTGTAVGDANDWASVWPLLAAVALLAQPGRPALLVGLALGLSAAVKLTVLPAVAVLGLAALVLVRDRGRLVLGAVLAGGYWYARNAAHTGSPLPLLDLGPLPHVPSPELDAVSASAVSYLDDGDVVREWFVPGLAFALGPLWPLLLVAVAAGLLVGLRTHRAAALAGIASVAGWALTPTSAGGLPGQPFLFVYNVRYALAGLVLGLVLLALAVPARVAVAGLAVLLASALLRDTALPEGVAPTAVVAAAALLLVVLRPRLAVPAAALGLVALVPLQLRYDDQRYRGDDDPRQRLFAAAQELPSERTGAVGFPLLHPLTGPDLAVPVGYLGVEEDDGRFRDARSCEELLAAADGVDVVAVQKQRADAADPPALAWLRAADGVREAFTGETGSLFVLSADATCTVAGSPA